MRFCNARVIVKIGDITRENADAIVNAANKMLLGGGGVDGAIHRVGGKRIYDECLAIRNERFPKGLPTGLAVITTAGELPAKKVIHTVGPIYGLNNGRDAELLSDCYRNSLELAVEHKLRTIAFPSIATGAFHYPNHEAAAVSSRAIFEFLARTDKLTEIRLVFFSESDARMFVKHQNFD